MYCSRHIYVAIQLISRLIYTLSSVQNLCNQNMAMHHVAKSTSPQKKKSDSYLSKLWICAAITVAVQQTYAALSKWMKFKFIFTQ